MRSNCLFASVFALFLAPVAVTAQTPASDGGALAHIEFTTAQKQTLYQSISETQKNNAAPVGFRAAVGARAPIGLDFAPVPVTIAELMPQTKGLEAALVEGEVLLVDPREKKVIAIITPQPQP
jgi:hypothetical protein